MLCGVAHTMLELILFRALQGLGGGGLYGRCAVNYRGHRAASRARPLRRILRRDLRRRDRDRAFARWIHRRILLVAMDLLRQRPLRHPRVDRHRRGVAERRCARAARHRLRRHRRLDGVGVGVDPLHLPRGNVARVARLEVGHVARRRTRRRGGVRRPSRSDPAASRYSRRISSRTGSSRPASAIGFVSSASRCSAPSPSCRCTSKTSRERRRRARVCDCCR